MGYFDVKKKYLMVSTDNTYIKDGLQLWLDGIENTRNGHISNGLYELQDLSGNVYDFTLLGGTAIIPEEKCIPFNGDAVYRCSDATLGELLVGLKNRTIEIVCSISDTDTNAKTIFLGGKSGSLNSGVGMWYRPASSGMCVSGNSNAHSVSDITNPHTYSAIYDDIAINNTNIYQDNKLLTQVSGGTMANLTVTVGGRYYSSSHATYRFYGKIYCIRVYDRQLTQAEREHNRKIDKERFGI